MRATWSSRAPSPRPRPPPRRTAASSRRPERAAEAPSAREAAEAEASAAATDPMIECRDIRKDYGEGENLTTVLKDVSFTIADGEFVAIMGPSGSGKSTLMNIIGALDTPTSGTYLLDGHDVSKLSDDELADIR